jgi:hypothetical protein
MGQSRTLKYQVGRAYKFGNAYYLAFKSRGEKVYFKPSCTSLTAPIGTRLPKKGLVKTQQYRPTKG